MTDALTVDEVFELAAVIEHGTMDAAIDAHRRLCAGGYHESAARTMYLRGMVEVAQAVGAAHSVKA